MSKTCIVFSVATVVISLLYVDAAQAIILHRWSFNGDLNDSVGGATATLGGDSLPELTPDGKLDITSNPLLSGLAELPVQASLQANISTEISFECWYQVDELNNYLRLWFSGDSYTEGFQYMPRVETQGAIQYWSDSTPGHGANVYIGSGPTVIDTPYHIVGTYKDNTALAVYVNGALHNSVSVVGKASASHSDFAKTLIGSNWIPGYTTGPSALIDEFRIYNHALSAGEVATNFANGPNGAIVTAPNGDYNNDGTVNAADYVVWRDNVNTTNQLPNDNGIGGAIGDQHYLLWKSNFGNSGAIGSVLSASSVVPEPMTTLLVLMCLGGMVPFSRGLRGRRRPCPCDMADSCGKRSKSSPAGRRAQRLC